MLTVDYEIFDLNIGDKVLDLGCGAGRHAFETFKRGGQVVALDQDDVELKNVAGLFVALSEEEGIPTEARALALRADALELPFKDGSFDRIIASEVLEHVLDDRAAFLELSRVLKPRGIIAITVPRFYPELINWALSNEYHEVPGGHVRIYRLIELNERLNEVKLKSFHHHYAHGLHSPYWWLKCYFGVNRKDVKSVNVFKKLLEWEIIKQPKSMDILKKIADPLMGKSVIIYAQKEVNVNS